MNRAINKKTKIQKIKRLEQSRRTAEAVSRSDEMFQQRHEGTDSSVVCLLAFVCPVSLTGVSNVFLLDLLLHLLTALSCWILFVLSGESSCFLFNQYHLLAFWAQTKVVSMKTGNQKEQIPNTKRPNQKGTKPHSPEEKKDEREQRREGGAYRTHEGGACHMEETEPSK